MYNVIPAPRTYREHSWGSIAAAPLAGLASGALALNQYIGRPIYNYLRSNQARQQVSNLVESVAGETVREGTRRFLNSNQNHGGQFITNTKNTYNTEKNKITNNKYKFDNREYKSISSTGYTKGYTPMVRRSRINVKGRRFNTSRRGYTGRKYRRYPRSRYPAGLSGKRVYKICDTILKKRIEKKYHEIYLGFNVTTMVRIATATFFSLSDIPQGQNDTSRIGDKVWMNALWIKGEINFLVPIMAYPNNTAPTHWLANPTPFLVRIIIIQWFDNDQYNAPTINKFLQTSDPNNTNLWDHDESAQYWVLHDKTYTWCQASHPAVPIDMIIKPVKKKIDFMQGTAAGLNKIFLACLCDPVQTSQTNQPTDYATQFASWAPRVYLKTRLTFYDS